MKTKIKSFVAIKCLIGSLFIISGCSEVEPVNLDQIDEPEEVLMTRAIADDYLATAVISGPSQPNVNINVQYSYPAIPSGSGLIPKGWTITPNTFTYVSHPSANPLEIKFNATGSYTIRMHFYMRLSTGGYSPDDFYIEKTVNVIDYFSTAVISGPSQPNVNINVQYSYPAIPSGSGLLFRGWEITPNTFMYITHPLANPLEIKFTAPGNYTVRAYFYVSNGETYIQKSVFVI
uniref:Uncharacterized protein n=1 Tax=termite gut metagenome TaxID=433724 RepID=S0DGG2_9ZZZZ